MKKIYLCLSLIILLSWAGNHAFSQCCNFTYQQQVEPATSAATFGVALGDFDNDGDSDAVAISAYYGIDVYFNNGSGTFTLNAQYATGTYPDFYGVHVCDVDGDNDQDIIAIPFYTTSSLTILKNNGSGVFTTYSYSSNIATYNGAIGDIDGDNDIDVFLPNAGGGDGKVFKNSGTGVYTLFQTVAGARGHDAELGDLDGDGDKDAFVVENSAYGNTVFLNNGSGTFTLLGTPFGSDGSNVGLGDLDGDGDLDAWVGTFNNTSEIWTNNGSGTFTLDTTFITGSYCKAMNLYDYDCDGDLDAFLGFYSSAPEVWTNLGNLKFNLCYQAPVGSSSHGLTIGYINNDALIDIYSGYFSNDDGDYVFLNAGTVNASIEYKNSPYCPYLTAPQTVTHTGASGGIYSAAPSGLTIDPSTGAITPSTSLPGTYTVTYVVSSCPFTTQVVITSLDLTTTTTEPTITANQSGATYQWLDCDNSYSPIGGQTSQSFVATWNGNYAVVVTHAGCTDTSACAPILTIGNQTFSKNGEVEIYPNPAGDQITVHFPDQGSDAISLRIYDATGRQVGECKNVKNDQQIGIRSLGTGIYLFQFFNAEMPVGSVKLTKL